MTIQQTSVETHTIAGSLAVQVIVLLQCMLHVLGCVFVAVCMFSSLVCITGTSYGYAIVAYQQQLMQTDLTRCYN